MRPPSCICGFRLIFSRNALQFLLPLMVEKEITLVFPQLTETLFRQMENIFKDPVHYGDYLAEFVGIMMGIPLLL